MQQKLIIVHEILFPLMNGVYDIANHEFKPFLVGKGKKIEYFVLPDCNLSGQHIFSCSLLWHVFLLLFVCVCIFHSLYFIVFLSSRNCLSVNTYLFVNPLSLKISTLALKETCPCAVVGRHTNLHL